ncbi:hypothetical protein Ancab_018783 [Ancistrocladus abbreviatus]
MIIEISENVCWQCKCVVRLFAYVDLREPIATWESVDDDDGIILEGDVILGFGSYYPHMMLIEKHLGGFRDWIEKATVDVCAPSRGQVDSGTVIEVHVDSGFKDRSSFQRNPPSLCS